jgi:hypothetical protein
MYLVARAHLSEGGFLHCPFLVHSVSTAGTVDLVQVKVSDLVNEAPDVTDALKHSAAAERAAAVSAAAAAPKPKK